jgi:purine-binding chemotaxis protein CheW
MKSYLTFKIGKEAFAADITNVIEIINVPEITELPNSPDYVLGVINHRGKVLVAVDPKKKFDISSTLIKRNPCIVILETKTDETSHELGMLVDLAESVIEMDESEILPPPNIGAKLREDIISGVIKRNEEFIMVLNIENLFSKEFNIK